MERLRKIKKKKIVDLYGSIYMVEMHRTIIVYLEIILNLHFSFFKCTPLFDQTKYSFCHSNFIHNLYTLN